MPLVAVVGAQGAGGAVFSVSQGRLPSSPVVGGKVVLLVGDVAICPGHKTPTPSIITVGNPFFRVGAKHVAFVGSPTSCGHPLISSPTTLVIGAALGLLSLLSSGSNSSSGSNTAAPRGPAAGAGGGNRPLRPF